MKYWQFKKEMLFKTNTLKDEFSLFHLLLAQGRKHGLSPWLHYYIKALVGPKTLSQPKSIHPDYSHISIPTSLHIHFSFTHSTHKWNHYEIASSIM